MYYNHPLYKIEAYEFRYSPSNRKIWLLQAFQDYLLAQFFLKFSATLLKLSSLSV